ncbi:hypothetical protein CXF85_18930 [Colwellia sp. 75C3]|uniref:hypothetical protein n=1 Tax=Colwellia sp. 75C3 TaxID=888425 RepID=UPI000C34C7EC|nr:hypothetical protein [Colwellia sp. 75C3]PKG81533.1 hypothetical protein CXF85_18930 [Colwellia sp. 75C3]
MKIFIIILLMNVISCSSQPNNNYQKKVLETKTKSSHAQRSKKTLPIGIWEGISRSGAEFKVLKIMPDNQHSLTSFNIASGMQFHESVSFQNEDIECDEFNCHIFTVTADENLPLKISLTKFIGQDYLVTETVRLSSASIYSSSYKLKATKSKTTPERFIAQESKKLKAIVLKHKKERFGYWSGILEHSNEDELNFATLVYQPEQMATLTVYSPGSSYPITMTFNPEWLQQSNGELKTKLKGFHFASQITLRYQSRDMIDGDFEQRFERYPERLLGHGNFRLYRVKHSEDYKQPKWLKSLLKSQNSTK